MLERPDLQEETIISCVEKNYGLDVEMLSFLPLGADLNSAVYRVDVIDGTGYFLKLRSGSWDQASVTYPRLLSDNCISQIIPPLPTTSGALWASVGRFKTILYPFVEGEDGYERRLSDAHWQTFGRTVKAMHAVEVPPAIGQHIRAETYTPKWRNRLEECLACVDGEEPKTPIVDEPIAKEVAAFLRTKRDEILGLIAQAQRFADLLLTEPRALIVCHADLHAGNILINKDDEFYLVDWDTLVMAPKERDLMYIGGALMAGHRSPEEEETLFYEGYGKTQIDPIALAYYRLERIIEDLAIYSESLLFSEEGGDDRPQGLHALKANFMPERTIEMAYRAVAAS